MYDCSFNSVNSESKLSLSLNLKSKKVYWKENVPFVIAGLKVYDCHHGKDRNISKKNKEKMEKVQ